MKEIENIDFDEIAKDLQDMEQECIVLFDSNWEVGLHNHGDDYYKAQAEFDELSDMTTEELEQQDIVAYAYMSGYELIDTGCQESADINILSRVFEICDQVGFAVGSVDGFYDEE